jgi:ABC-type glycerol-3-phosphate transport system substrate-binding protein
VWAKSNQDLPNKKCLFYSNGSWMYNIWEQENPEEITNIYPNEYPSFNESKVYPSAYFIVWGVLKNSPNRDEAVKMLMAMNSPDMADQWVQTTKCPTGINGNMTDVMFGKDQYDDFSVHIQNNYSDNNYNFSEELCQNIIGSPDMAKNHYRDVLEGNMTADEAMELIRTNLIN